MEEKAAAGPWISVKDKLPKRGSFVLVRLAKWAKIGQPGIKIECAVGDPKLCSGWQNHDTDDITHWAEINPPAKE